MRRCWLPPEPVSYVYRMLYPRLLLLEAQASRIVEELVARLK